MSKNDGLLYTRFLDDHDHNALEILFNKYRDSLILFIHGFIQNLDDAEELMMDTFAILASGTTRYKAKENASFKTWLYAIAKNQALLYLRKRKIKYISTEKDVLNNLQADVSFQPVNILLENERDKRLYRAMESIDANYRQVLFLQCFENMKPEQICRIIRKNIKQTYNLLARGKEALRLAYERMGLSWDA